MSGNAALDMNASLTLKNDEIEAIIKAELERRGHTVEMVSLELEFSALTLGFPATETKVTEGRVMAKVTIKL